MKKESKDGLDKLSGFVNIKNNLRIFLCGGAELQVDELNKTFASEVLKSPSKTLLYIPIAHPEIVAKGIVYTHYAMYDVVKAYFLKFGLKRVEMWRDLAGKSFNDLKRFGGVYIGGGYEFKLLYDLKRSGFDKILRRYIDNGKPVYGSSAGALVLGKDIRTGYMCIETPGEDKVIGLKSFAGLNKVDNCIISVHYKRSFDKEIFNLAKKLRSRILALPFKAGAYLLNGKLYIVTDTDPAYLFDSKNKVKLENGIVKSLK